MRIPSLLVRYKWLGVAAFAAGIAISVGMGSDSTMRSTPDEPLTSLHLQDLTWTEVARSLQEGFDTAIIPTGGTEVNGPHVILGKHNYVVGRTAELIATALGNTLIAPVMAYVPEGDYGAEPTLHMRFPGTLTVREETFEALLEDTARSLVTHGFRRIIFIGDSGWNQETQQSVAAKLTQEWEDRGIKVVHASDYYAANGQTEWLTEQGYSLEQIGLHAGIRDTSEVMAIYPDGVRQRFVPAPEGMGAGFNGAPSLASPEIGERMISLKVEAALRQIARASE